MPRRWKPCLYDSGECAEASGTHSQRRGYVEGTLKGHYGKQQMPEATLHMSINQASAKYADLPYGIDDLTAEFSGYVDFMRHKPRMPI